MRCSSPPAARGRCREYDTCPPRLSVEGTTQAATPLEMGPRGVASHLLRRRGRGLCRGGRRSRKGNMKRILAIAALLAAPAARAERLPFQPGEQMDFAVAWLHIPTGRARLSLGRAEGSVWPMILLARTDGVAS